MVEIPRPQNMSFATTNSVARPTFTAVGGVTGGFTAVNNRSTPYNVIDLTTTSSRFGQRPISTVEQFTTDPYHYMDSSKATESIKALLEGSFDDEEDKPRTRGRKKKLQNAASDLATKLKVMSVEEETGKEGEEDEDEEDGVVEGLNVQLLPHQMDGISWMRDKEAGERKNGVLPKGGILADDVRPHSLTRKRPCYAVQR